MEDKNTAREKKKRIFCICVHLGRACISVPVPFLMANLPWKDLSQIEKSVKGSYRTKCFVTKHHDWLILLCSLVVNVSFRAALGPNGQKVINVFLSSPSDQRRARKVETSEPGICSRQLGRNCFREWNQWK